MTDNPRTPGPTAAALAVLDNDARWAAEWLQTRSDLTLHVIALDERCAQTLRQALADPITAGRVVITAGNQIEWSASSQWKFGFHPTIDDYCRRHQVAHLSLLYLQATGLELEILRGSVDLLRRGDVDLIQFEYSGHFKKAGITLHELYAYLIPFGYRLFRLADEKLQPQGEILPADENYHPAELVAMRSQPTDPPKRDESSCVAMSSVLGGNGRFANQLFQYAFLRILARHHGMDVQTSPWIGQLLFGHDDPPPVGQPPICVEGREIAEGVFPDWLMATHRGSIDLWGYFGFDTVHYAPYRDFFRSLYRPLEPIERPMKSAVENLRADGHTLVGMHLRRGDFGSGKFFIAPTEWYVKFLKELWPTLNRPILLIASDEPQKVLADFADFTPRTAADLGMRLPQAPFYPDFYLLTQCDVLAISNSSFSFVAAMLNERAKIFCRPHLHLQKLIPFDPWNASPQLHRELGKPLRQSVTELIEHHRAAATKPRD
ncbi:MAG: alpha-1,2-fucosyltransferase [Tepidisphaeraceae bacterium]|jgi:hypothetical protein